LRGLQRRRERLGRPIAIVGVTGPSFRMRRNRFPFYRQEVLRSARAAAVALGYDPAPPAAGYHLS